jgi:acetoin utilization protein AcuC
VQPAFWEDPRVLTVSLHEQPRTLFPYTGWPEETGAEGAAVNLALPAGTGNMGWLRAFQAVVPEVIADFRPQVLVTQQGADTHFEDPLAVSVVVPLDHAVRSDHYRPLRRYVLDRACLSPQGARWHPLFPTRITRPYIGE